MIFSIFLFNKGILSKLHFNVKTMNNFSFYLYLCVLYLCFSLSLVECNNALLSAPSVVRSGDYYLFETDSEEEEEEEEKKDDELQKRSAFQVTSSCGSFFHRLH